MRIGDRVRVTEAWRKANGNTSLITGTLIEVLPSKFSGTVSATGKPCRRTHHVKLDKPLSAWDYLTFCPEDLENEPRRSTWKRAKKDDES